MRTKIFALLVGAGLLLAVAPVWAHHAFAAEFDQNKPLKLKGTVTKWEVSNPHSWIHIDVKGDDGKVTNWMIEGGSPNNLYRLGFTKDSLPAVRRRPAAIPRAVGSRERPRQEVRFRGPSALAQGPDLIIHDHALGLVVVMRGGVRYLRRRHVQLRLA